MESLPELVDPTPKRRLARFVSVLLTVVVVWLVFGVVLPSIADYDDIWAAVSSMSVPVAIALLLGGFGVIVLMALVLPAALTGLRSWAAILTQPMSVAVAAVVPGGYAPARAVFLRPYGVRTASYTRSYAAAALATTLCVLLMPAVGLVIFVLLPQPSGARKSTQVVALVVCVLALIIAGAVIALISSSKFCRWCARAGAALVSKSGWLSSKLATATWEDAVLSWREDTVRIMRRRRRQLAWSTLGAYWSNGLLMVLCMYACGLPMSALGIGSALATFTVARTLLSVPLTPGGVGVLELGYSAIFGIMVAEEFSDSVIAGVLVYRALTYVLPVFLGGVLLLLTRLRGSKGNIPAETAAVG